MWIYLIQKKTSYNRQTNIICRNSRARFIFRRIFQYTSIIMCYADCVYFCISKYEAINLFLSTLKLWTLCDSKMVDEMIVTYRIHFVFISFIELGHRFFMAQFFFESFICTCKSSMGLIFFLFSFEWFLRKSSSTLRQWKKNNTVERTVICL